jgi:hypothetical protein
MFDGREDDDAELPFNVRRIPRQAPLDSQERIAAEEPRLAQEEFILIAQISKLRFVEPCFMAMA